MFHNFKKLIWLNMELLTNNLNIYYQNSYYLSNISKLDNKVRINSLQYFNNNQLIII